MKMFMEDSDTISCSKMFLIFEAVNLDCLKLSSLDSHPPPYPVETKRQSGSWAKLCRRELKCYRLALVEYLTLGCDELKVLCPLQLPYELGVLNMYVMLHVYKYYISFYPSQFWSLGLSAVPKVFIVA